MASASSVNTGAEKKAILRGIAYSIIINAVLPFIIYSLLKRYTNTSDFWALVISGIPPMIDAIVGIIRKSRIDLVAGIILLGIVVSIILVILGGSPRLLLIRESFFTAAFGLVYLVSLLFPRPLTFYFARHFATGNVPEKVARFNSLWQDQSFRSFMTLITFVWGLGFLLEAAIRTFLVFTLTIPQFLIISPLILNGILGGIVLWTILYSRKRRQLTRAIMPPNIKVAGTSTTEE